MGDPQMMKTADTVTHVIPQAQFTLEGVKPLNLNVHLNSCFRRETEVNNKTKCPCLWPNSHETKIGRLCTKVHVPVTVFRDLAKNCFGHSYNLERFD